MSVGSSHTLVSSQVNRISGINPFFKVSKEYRRAKDELCVLIQELYNELWTEFDEDKRWRCSFNKNMALIAALQVWNVAQDNPQGICDLDMSKRKLKNQSFKKFVQPDRDFLQTFFGPIKQIKMQPSI